MRFQYTNHELIVTGKIRANYFRFFYRKNYFINTEQIKKYKYVKN